jgi:hypothetical protein
VVKKSTTACLAMVRKMETDIAARLQERERQATALAREEEPVGGWQRDLVNEVLGRRDSTPVEGGDPARKRADAAVQLRVRKCSVNVSVSFRSVAVEVVRAEDDFERAAAADEIRRPRFSWCLACQDIFNQLDILVKEVRCEILRVFDRTWKASML